MARARVALRRNLLGLIRRRAAAHRCIAPAKRFDHRIFCGEAVRTSPEML